MKLLNKIKQRILPYYKSVKGFLFYHFYINSHIQEQLIDQISGKEKIKVVFFAINVAMWKYDQLFQLLMRSERFEPCIVSYLLPWDSMEERMKVQNELKTFFTSKGYAYNDCYDFNKNEWLDVLTLNPDIIFYTQPYNNGYKKYRIEHLYKKAIFAYAPYSSENSPMKEFHNLLMQNVAWKMFYANQYQKRMEELFTANKGVNVEVVGNLILDDINRGVTEDPWKIKGSKLKRIIWSPHHTVSEKNIFPYSTFLQVADHMIALAQKYKDEIQFVFKPHPLLKTTLYDYDGWGKERTDRYYKQWNDMPNTTYVNGEYINLFLTSDALIHDCSSFTTEYLFTGKPCMFLVRGDHYKLLNEFDRKSFDMHYKGYTIQDIDDFIEKVILHAEDPMQTDRIKFKKQYLLPPYGNSPSQNIFDSMVKEFSKRHATN